MDATLVSLEALLDEFFSPAATNDRKRQIEELLNRFGVQDGAWVQCLYFLEHSNNNYVQMYSFSILESIVNTRWHSFPVNDKQQIRKFVHTFLLTKQKQVAAFIRNKCVKVYVNIGRIDWPMFYPTFLSNILKLLKNAETVLTGVIALQTASEEFISPRDDLNMTRRIELKKELLKHAPEALQSLTNILTSLNATAAPITSPFHTPHPSPHESPTHLTNKPNHVQMDGAKEELCVAIFDCLQQYMSWLPLAQFVTPTLVNKLFVYCPLHLVSTNVGVHALNCLNEILSKKFVPADYEAFLLQMFQQTFSLLQTLSDASDISSIDETYLDTLTEFLNLFVSNHLSRFEPHTQFPTVEFLVLLHKYTVVQDSLTVFVECLEVWIVILDYLIDKVTSCITLNFKMAALQNYVVLLEEFTQELLCKIQHRHNHEWLEQVSHDEREDSEWKSMLNKCLEVVSKVSQLLPDSTLQRVSEILDSCLNIYFGLSEHLNDQELTIPQSDFDTLHSSMGDLSTALCVTGTLATIFTDDVTFQNRAPLANAFLEKLLKGALFGCYYNLCSVKNIPMLQQDFIHVQSQSVASCQAYCYWLGKQYNMLTLANNSEQKTIHEHVTTIVEIVLATTHCQMPLEVQRAGCYLLVSLTTTVRPQFLTSLTQTQKLYKDVDVIIGQSDVEVKSLMYTGLSNALLLPWPVTTNQDWEKRAESHKLLLTPLINTFVEIQKAPTQQGKERLKTTCSVLKEVIEAVSNEGTPTRKIVYESIRPAITACVSLLSTYVNETDVSGKMFSILLVSVKHLRAQMGISFVEEIIKTILSLLNRERMDFILTSNGCQVLESFIEMLEVIVKVSGASFKKLLPSILAFTLESLLPAISQQSVPDLCEQLLEFFHQLLLHNWRYFFKSDVISKMNGTDQLENEPQFVGILKAFGDPLLRTEISLFKKSITTLQSLNEKQRLYEKAIFQSTMLSSFLQVLMTSLVRKSHNLLQEDIIETIHSMVLCNFDAYFSQFTPLFLMNCPGITDHQRTQLHDNYKRHQDLPSFTASLQSFIGDLRYYQIINANIQPVSL